MLMKPSSLFLLLFLFLEPATSKEADFTFNGFSNANLSLDGIASITSNGILELTNTTQNMTGHAFFPIPLRFKSPSGDTLSFTATFVFAILPEVSDLSGQGLAFVVTPTTDPPPPSASQYLGIFTEGNNGNSSNHILAVELDTIQNPEFQDINDNHVGIDVNSLHSVASQPAGYYEDGTGSLKNLILIDGQPMQVWIEFDAKETELNVTLAPLRMRKPSRPLLSSTVDLGSLMLDSMYVGFSSNDGPFHSRHYILGWSFNMGGIAGPLDYAKLPSLPAVETNGDSFPLATWLPVASCSIALLAVAAVVVVVRRRMKYAEVVEDWEVDYGPHRFSFKDLHQATDGFKERGLLGSGGFGRVYRGVLPASGMEIAVKRVGHDSRQGMREFVAEIVSIGRLRHRNLVQLLGYCRRKGELLLVYDFMPNGSLDKFLYDRTRPALSWAQRLRIIKGVASGLLYLHEDWEQVVVHRDVKASNVLLDVNFDGRLGDFGLAKLYDRGSDPQTTRVVGTLGYIAPELTMNGKATAVSDVYAFGTFVLEVVCGRRPIMPHSVGEDLVLVDWVHENWRRGLLLETADPRLGGECCAEEAELVLKLGLLCSHPIPAVRPSMRQVILILDGDAELPPSSPSSMSFTTLALYQNVGFDGYIRSLTSLEA